ncbi:S8 family serine peptidase [Glutamicibacter sp. NPDC127525]|uniref:S8 family peptidase n=1 Tax=unclassified Glutamicibacter TaxID=2627139 RepID=UPI003625E2B8
MFSEYSGDSLGIALIDGGVEDTHPALGNVEVRNFIAPGLSPGTTDHATGMASIALNKMKDLSPIGATSTLLLDIKALSDDGTGEIEDLVSGIYIALREGADIILCSLNVEIDSSELQRAVLEAHNQGVIVIAAAGNGFGHFNSYPADYDGVISVGAVDGDQRRLRFTNTGYVDILAPGQDIHGASGVRDYTKYSGTSPAAAIAAGMIAGCWKEIDTRKIYQLPPNLTVEKAIVEIKREKDRNTISCQFN